MEGYWINQCINVVYMGFNTSHIGLIRNSGDVCKPTDIEKSIFTEIHALD